MLKGGGEWFRQRKEVMPAEAKVVFSIALGSNPL